MSSVQVDTTVQYVVVQETPQTTVEILENNSIVNTSVINQGVEVVQTNNTVAVQVDNSQTTVAITEDNLSIIEVGLVGPAGPQGPAGDELEVPYNEETDFVGDTIIYKGWADPGTPTSAASWRIKKITFVGVDEDPSITWADGNGNFDNIWNDREGLSYS